MTPRPGKSDPVWELIDAVCYSDADVEQLQQLDRRLSEDSQVCDLYNDYCQLHAALMFRAKNQESFEAFRSVFPASRPSPYLGFLGGLYQGTVSYFSQEVPFALLMGAVIMGIGLLAGSLISVTHYMQIADETKTPDANQHVIDTTNYIGRITGMADVQWADESTVALEGARVPLGQKYALASGLMEITYDTGAKVILQGPVTYEVDSTAGGFLAVGKLTARLEKRGEGREESKEKVASGQKLVVSGQWSVASENNLPSPASGRGVGGEGGGQPEKVAGGQPLVVSGQWLVASKEGAGVRGQGPEAANHKSEIINQKSLAPMFAVRTPSAIVTDLGTEFGVEVDKKGVTTSHVFQGLVRLQVVAKNGSVVGEAQLLHENQSARVAADNDRRAVVLPPSEKTVAFVRAIPRQEKASATVTKAFDLVDIVAGGDGFSGRRGMGIDPTTGQVSDKEPKWQPPPNEYLIGDGKYHRVEKRPFIDGIFIPNGEVPVQVDSAGHTFASFPITKNETAGFLWAGGTIPNSSPFPATRTDLGGIDYASKGHGLLLVHANKGITFDLQAIRRANSGWRLTRFLATAGITSDASVADFWVLVDGHIRFRRWQTNSTYGAIPISVALSENERFLTLAATDGGNGISADWTIFGDPRLELAKNDKSEKSEKQHP